MTRVSTFGNYQSALLDLMSAQSRAETAQKKVNTQKNATDLVGFGRGSETVSALKSSQTRIQTFIAFQRDLVEIGRRISPQAAVLEAQAPEARQNAAQIIATTSAIRDELGLDASRTTVLASSRASEVRNRILIMALLLPLATGLLAFFVLRRHLTRPLRAIMESIRLASASSAVIAVP